MDAPSIFTRREEDFLAALADEGVEFLIVGLAAAALQGVPAVTQDIDLWFGPLNEERISSLRRALDRVGATFVASTATTPPLIVGGGADLFDLVVHMHGLDSFERELEGAVRLELGRVVVPALPLKRIIASKRATDRPKDRAILPVLEDALRTIEGRRS